MQNKLCPQCKRKYTEIENYCTKCGVKLEKEPNRYAAAVHIAYFEKTLHT